MDLIPASKIAVAVGRTRAAVVRAAALGKLPGARLVTSPQRYWRIPAVYRDPAVYMAAVGPSGRKRRVTLPQDETNGSTPQASGEAA